MPADAPFLPVDGPRLTPLPHGLLSVAQIVDDPNPHWRGGTVFQPDSCEPGRATTVVACGPNGVEGTVAKTPTGGGEPLSAALPFTVYAMTTCAPVGWGDDLADLVARATRNLDAGESRALEAVVWTGANEGPALIEPHLAADTQTWATDHGAAKVELQSVAQVLTAGADIAATIGLLEQAMADCAGGQGVIHVPRSLLSILGSKGLVEARGPQLLTHGGNLVAGYSGEGVAVGPSGQDPTWIYGTGPVMVRRSAVSPAGRRPADFVDRTNNSTVFVVERTYVVDWGCCHFAMPVPAGDAPGNGGGNGGNGGNGGPLVINATPDPQDPMTFSFQVTEAEPEP